MSSVEVWKIQNIQTFPQLVKKSGVDGPSDPQI